MNYQNRKRATVSRKTVRVAIAATVVLGVAFAASQARGANVTVRAGDDLQAAINEARPGDVLRLEAGATFTGNFVLPAKAPGEPITIRTSTDDRRLPSEHDRVAPAHQSLLPTIAQQGAEPALRTAPGAKGWRLVGIRFAGNGSGDLITLGDGGDSQNSYSHVPENITLDRVLVQGDPEKGQKRGIALNSADTTIRNSHIADIKAVGQETQAIAGWNGPGPFLIENNHLEAAGICVLFGGAEPSIGSLVPSNIVVRRNTMTRPIEWRDAQWTVKNLLELKNAREVMIEGNVMERNWAAAQVGFAVLFTVRASGPTARWSTIENVTFQNNLVRGVAGGINILGFDTDRVTQQARNILIRNNLFDDVDHERWGGNGMFLQVGDEPADITVERNTVLQSGNLVTAYGGTSSAPRPIRGFRFVNNIGRHNSYGVFGNGRGVGNPAIDAYFPGAVITGNVIAGGSARLYPPGNMFPSLDELMRQFANPAGGDLRLRADSAWRSSASDGGSIGVDHAELFRAIGGMGLR
jgi:hypothetical protein